MKKTYFFFVTLMLMTSLVYSQTTILSEDFENASGTTPPTGWTRTSNGVGWKFGANLGSQYWHIPSHTKYAAANDDAAGQNNDGSVDYLISPAIDLSGYTTVLLKFAKFFDGKYDQLASVEISTDGGNNWTSVYTVPKDDEWAEKVISLSNYAGQSNVMIGFHSNDTGRWSSGFAVDDVQVYKPVAYDVSLVSIDTPPYVTAGNVNIQGTLQNLGQTNLTSIDLMWSIDGGTTYTTDHLTGINVAPGDFYNFTQTTPIDMSATHGYNVTIKLENPNGQSDQIPNDNTLTKQISSLSQIPTKRFVGEEAGGTWCGWCPRGLVALKDMAHYHPNHWIGISVHNGDPMTNSAYDSALSTHRGGAGFPGGLFNRVGGNVDPGNYSAIYQEKQNELTPVDIDITNISWNAANRTISFDVEATFYTNFTGDFRINAVITEDHVSGTSSSWGQHNYYHNRYDLIDWEGINWKNLPSTVPASQMVYDDVARAILAGWDGTPGSIPSTIVDGVTHSQSYTYTVPASSDENNINLIGLVIDQNTGAITNGFKKKFDLAAGIADNTAEKISLYPNPTNGIMHITNAKDASVEVWNILGQRVIQKHIIRNDEINISGLKNGNYIVKIITEKGTNIQKITLIK